MSPDDVPDCQACGACCHGPGPRYVPVTGADLARLEAACAALGATTPATTFDARMRRWLDMAPHPTGWVCPQLQPAPDGRCACAVYPGRPEACRQVERGDPACRAAIARLAPV